MKGVYADLTIEHRQALEYLKAKTDRPIRSLIAEGIEHLIVKYGVREQVNQIDNKAMGEKNIQLKGAQS